jgi:hypothetical protein
MAQSLTGRFTVLVEGQLRTYSFWSEVPQVIDEVVAFQPHYPPPPHNPQQHAEILQWNTRLQELMRRRRAASNPGR